MGEAVRKNEVGILWKPNPKQALALACPAFELLYGGAKGGGKSDFVLIDFLHGIEYGPKHRGILFRKSYPELEELIHRSKEIYPQLGATYKESTHEWKFPSGSHLKLRFLESDKDVLKYQGHQYTHIAFDELTLWATDFCYTYMLSCARSPHGIPVRVRATANPGGPGHAWVKQRFVDVCEPGKIWHDPDTGLTRAFIPATLDDNPYLAQNDPQYVKRLEALPSHLYKAYRYGDWNVFAGQVFEEFSEATHVVEPFPIPASWKKFCSLDWGYAKPFSIGWWAVDGDGRLIRYREWYGCERGKPDTGLKMAAKEVAQKAWEMSVAEGCIDMVADPACWTKIDTSPSIAEEFEAVGWRMEKANNDRRAGLQRVHDLMSLKGADGRPMLLVFSTCKDFIRTFPMLVASKRDPEDIDTDCEDHIYDETRYAVMSSFSRKPAETKGYTSHYHHHTQHGWMGA